MSLSSHELVDTSLELSWSLWTELGLPGVVRHHREYAMDVEPLMLFTSHLADHDPRLRDESIVWVARHHKFVSRARLRGLLKLESQEAPSDFGPYAGSISEVTPGTWPGATAPSWPPPPLLSADRQKSFEEPSLLRLRLRALVGVGARAEIAHAFVAQPEARLSAQDLVSLSGFTKGNLNQELDAFVLAGLLSRAGTGNRWVYRLADPERLLRFAGARPRVFVDWVATLRLLGALLALFADLERHAELARAVEIAAFMRRRAEDLERAGFPRQPPGVAGEGLAAWFDSAAATLVRTLATPAGAA